MPICNECLIITHEAILELLNQSNREKLKSTCNGCDNKQKSTNIREMELEIGIIFAQILMNKIKEKGNQNQKALKRF